MWKYSNETLITHPDKTFDPPIPPGYEVEVTPGDGVELPPGTEIVTEPTSPNETTGESGGETIVGGPLTSSNVLEYLQLLSHLTNQSERVILQNQMVLILFFFIFVRSSFRKYWCWLSNRR